MLLEKFKEMKKILDKHNVSFWLEHGTLLGAYRDGKMIYWDNDIDLATWFEPFVEKHPQISKDLFEMGYDVYITDTKFTIKKEGEHVSVYLYKQNEIPGNIRRYRISKKDNFARVLLYGFLEGLKTPKKDLISKYTVKTKALTMWKHLVMSLPGKDKINDLLTNFGTKIDSIFVYDILAQSAHVGSLKEITFHDMKVKIPQDSEGYLVHLYGKNWRIPDENWDRNWKFFQLMESYNTRRDLIYNLKKIVDVVNKKKIPFWLYDGSLVAYRQDGDLIPWEKSLDLFVWDEDYPKILDLKKELQELGFKLKEKEKSLSLCWDDKKIVIQHYSKQGDNAIIKDRHVVKTRLGHVIYHGFVSRALKYKLKTTARFFKKVFLSPGGGYKITQKVPAKFFLNLKEIDFYGITLKVPTDKEKFPKYLYEKDWATPDKNYDRFSEQYKKLTLQNVNN